MYYYTLLLDTKYSYVKLQLFTSVYDYKVQQFTTLQKCNWVVVESRNVGNSHAPAHHGPWHLMVCFEKLCHNYLFHLKMLVVDCRNLVEVAIFGKMLRHLVVSCLLGELQVACFLLILRQDDVLSCGVKHNHCQKTYHIWSIVLCVVLG